MSTATDLDSVVVFRLGAQAFALAAGAVREVVPVAWLARPVQMPSLVEGILNLGGTAVPVLRLDRLLGVVDARFGLGASILIMRGPQPLGVLVEHVDSVRSVSQCALAPVAAGRSLNGCLAGELDCGAAGTVHLVSWEGVLAAEERLRLAEFQARAQARLAELDGAEPADPTP